MHEKTKRKRKYPHLQAYYFGEEGDQKFLPHDREETREKNCPRSGTSLRITWGTIPGGRYRKKFARKKKKRGRECTMGELILNLVPKGKKRKGTKTHC